MTICLMVNVYFSIFSADYFDCLVLHFDVRKVGCNIPLRVNVLVWMPLLFVIGWLISLVVHAFQWYKNP